jgi:hypothetical protein
MRGKEILGRLLLAAVLAGAALVGIAIVFLGAGSGGRGRSFPPLHLAARSGNVETVTGLLDAGAGLEELDDGPNGWTPLLHAIHKGQLGVVRLLLARGADPNRPARNGTSPVNLAASQGELAILRALVAAGARVDGPSATEALLNAAAGGHTRVVRFLLDTDPGLRATPGLRTWVARCRAYLSHDREMLALLHRRGYKSQGARL